MVLVAPPTAVKHVVVWATHLSCKSLCVCPAEFPTVVKHLVLQLTEYQGTGGLEDLAVFPPLVLSSLRAVQVTALPTGVSPKL